jgi:hypothetical protein
MDTDYADEAGHNIPVEFEKSGTFLPLDAVRKASAKIRNIVR